MVFRSRDVSPMMTGQRAIAAHPGDRGDAFANPDTTTTEPHLASWVLRAASSSRSAMNWIP